MAGDTDDRFSIGKPHDQRFSGTHGNAIDDELTEFADQVEIGRASCRERV